MKLFPRLFTGMKFITPAQYIQAHFVINTTAVDEFTKVHKPLEENCFLVDFGCGTGETTLAMSKGILGTLGKPNLIFLDTLWFNLIR